MSDWDDSDTDNTDNTGSSGGGLRKQLEQALAEMKQLRADNAKLQGEARTQKVSTVLAAKGLDPKVAKLIPADVAATDKAIGDWIEEYGDLFNVKPAEEKPAEPEETPENDPESFEAQQEYIHAMRQMGVIGGGLLPPEKAKDLLAKVNDPNLTREGLIALVEAHGGGFGMG